MRKTKRVIAIMLTVAFALSLFGIMPVSSAENGEFKVAVFSADNTAEQTINVIEKWFNSNTVVADDETITNVTVNEISAEQIVSGELSNYDTLVVADAGSKDIEMGKTVMNALGSEAVVKIQDYIAAGGGYVGMGGGAFAATQTFTTAGDTTTYMNLIKYRVDYPNWNHGTGEVIVQPQNATHTLTKGMQASKRYIAFVDAPPVFKTVADNQVKDTRAGAPSMIMKYHSNVRNGLGAAVNVKTGSYVNMTGTAAMSYGMFGSGRVVVSGLLLQSSQSVNMDFLLGRALLYTAGYNTITATVKSAEQKQLPVVAEWIWASEVTSKGVNGAQMIAQRCKEMGVTDVYLQVKGTGGSVAYNKGTVPLKRANSTRDVLQEMLTACHAQGIRVHAWISALSDSTYADYHIEETLYHFVRGYDSKAEGKDWSSMDPTLPNYAKYVQSLLQELIKNYDVDGIHFDYIRYNHITYGWSEANIAQMEDEYGINVATLKGYVNDTYYKASPDDAKIFRMAASAECGYNEGKDALLFMQMRCDNIKKFAQGLVDAIRAVDEDITISAALMPEGAYQGNQYVAGRNDSPTASNSYGRMVFGQDYTQTPELFDYVCPMAYSDTYGASYQWMAAIAQSAVNMGNKVVMGIQAFTPANGNPTITSKTMMGETEAIRTIASEDGVLGIALFRTGLYAYAKSTYSASQNVVKVNIENAFTSEALAKVVLEMQDGLKAKSIVAYENISGATTNISEDGKTVTISKANLIPSKATSAIYLAVEGELNRTLGPCFVNVFAKNETRAYQIYEEGEVELPPPPTPKPTMPNAANNFTMQQVLDGMTEANNYMVANSGNIPNTVMIDNVSVSKASLFRLACVALYNASVNCSRDALVSHVVCKNPTGSSGNSFNSTVISRDGYLYAAEKQLQFVDSNGYMPAGYTTFPGQSGLSYSGQLGYANMLRAFIRALTFYNKYNVLPDQVSIQVTEATTPTPPPATPTPTNTPEPTPTPSQTPGDVMAGDVTLDGKVNSRDIATLQKAIVGASVLSEEQTKAADLNGDSKLNSRDISALQRMIVG